MTGWYAPRARPAYEYVNCARCKTRSKDTGAFRATLVGRNVGFNVGFQFTLLPQSKAHVLRFSTPPFCAQLLVGPQ